MKCQKITHSFFVMQISRSFLTNVKGTPYIFAKILQQTNKSRYKFNNLFSKWLKHLEILIMYLHKNAIVYTPIFHNDNESVQLFRSIWQKIGQNRSETTLVRNVRDKQAPSKNRTHCLCCK